MGYPRFLGAIRIALGSVWPGGHSLESVLWPDRSLRPQGDDSHAWNTQVSIADKQRKLWVCCQELAQEVFLLHICGIGYRGRPAELPEFLVRMMQ